MRSKKVNRMVEQQLRHDADNALLRVPVHAQNQKKIGDHQKKGNAKESREVSSRSLLFARQIYLGKGHRQ